MSNQEATALKEMPGGAGRESDSVQTLDALIVGAGFSGLYALHLLRKQGLSVRAYEAGDDIGGAWYWNRYPGARCDSESEIYCYSFSDEILQEWEWTERFPDQAEILEYFDFVDSKLDLRKDVQFNTRIDAGDFDPDTSRWTIRLDDGKLVSVKYLVLSCGVLTAASTPDFKGLDQFKGKVIHTSQWPHEGVDFTGQDVGIVGTGSSGVQAVPVIAEQARHLTVFQRTPAFYIPARNVPMDPEQWRKIKETYSEMWEKAKHMPMGIPYDRDPRSAFDLTPEEREDFFETRWQEGGNKFLRTSFRDVGTDKAANDVVVEYLHRKIREAVDDPVIAEKLIPKGFPVGTKRVCTGTDYLEAFNRDNVTLVDVKSSPIQEITKDGVKTGDEEYKIDCLVLATGFDAMTGAFTRIDLRGLEGSTLKEKWEDGAKTYLGIMTAGFPNMFMVTGPQSPSALCNVPTAIEQHVEWITDCINYMQTGGHSTIDANPGAEKEWGEHCTELGNQTLFPQTDSWYMGANIPGKPRDFLVYIGGLDKYRDLCDEVAASGYKSLQLA